MRPGSRVLAIAVVATLALALVACASGALELTAEDAGTTQALKGGQELAVTLGANPSTGYNWEIDGELPAQLEQLGEPEFAAESQLAGAPGSQTWRFRAAAEGEGVLRLKYWRSFEPTVPPVATFEVTVEVE